MDRIGIRVLYSGVLIGLTLHRWHTFSTAGVRLKQNLFLNFCPGGRERYHSITMPPDGRTQTCHNWH